MVDSRDNLQPCAIGEDCFLCVGGQFSGALELPGAFGLLFGAMPKSNNYKTPAILFNSPNGQSNCIKQRFFL
jgi:hypothetical protein